MRRLRAALAIFAALLPPALPASALDPGEQLAIVEAVVDGDTVDVRLADGRAERIRLLGIDAPEIVDPSKLVQCFSTEASARAHELLDGKQVSVFADPTQDTKDQYGRLLAYIWLPDGAQYNYKMVVEGFALEYTDKTPYYFQADFKAGQQAAQAKQLGLWSPSTCNGDIQRVASTAPLAPNRSADSGTPPTPLPTAASTPSAGFDPAVYINKGNAYNCSDFRSQADAQAVLRAAPGDPNRLDTARDGIACENNPAPQDLNPVPR
jgi:micrococcal nuclease